MAGPGRFASVTPDSLGGVGNSLAGSVCSLDSNRSAATVTLLPPLSASMRMSVSGKALTISKSFFAGSVSVPGFETVASQRLRNATSRSVASRDTAPLLASISTFARIGMVFLRSTMPWRRDNSLSRSFLRTTNSMCRTGLSRSLLVGGSIYFFKKIKKTRDYSSNKRVLERAIPADYLLNINELPCARFCGYRGGKRGHKVFKNQSLLFSTSCPQQFTEQACGKPYCSDCIRVLTWLLKTASVFRRSSTFRMEWMTVEWCLPPKLLPISGSDALVRFLHRYMATCRGRATDFELFRDFNSPIFIW